MIKKAKILAILLLPLWLVLVLIGWSLYYAGSNMVTSKMRNEARGKERYEIQLGVLPSEEQHIRV
jgi:hypothetical protein